MKMPSGANCLPDGIFLLLGMYFLHTNLLLDAGAKPLPLKAQ